MPPTSGSTPARSRLGVWFSAAASTRLPSHTHADAELNLLMAGSAECETEAGRYTIRAGELFVLPGGMKHEMTKVSSDLAMWVMELGEGGRHYPRLGWLARCAVLSPSAPFRRELVQHLRKLWQRPNEARTASLENSVYHILGDVDSDPEGRVLRANPAVSRARRICEMEHGALSTQLLARRSGVSPSRLAHLFQDELGVTPLQYRNFVRLQHFIQRRETRDPSLLRSSFTAGFGSYAQFFRIFHQVCGEPPGFHLRWLESEAGIDPSRTMG